MILFSTAWGESKQNETRTTSAAFHFLTEPKRLLYDTLCSVNRQSKFILRGFLNLITMVKIYNYRDHQVVYEFLGAGKNNLTLGY